MKNYKKSAPTRSSLQDDRWWNNTLSLCQQLQIPSLGKAADRPSCQSPAIYHQWKQLPSTRDSQLPYQPCSHHCISHVPAGAATNSQASAPVLALTAWYCDLAQLAHNNAGSHLWVLQRSPTWKNTQTQLSCDHWRTPPGPACPTPIQTLRLLQVLT